MITPTERLSHSAEKIEQRKKEIVSRWNFFIKDTYPELKECEFCLNEFDSLTVMALIDEYHENAINYFTICKDCALENWHEISLED